MKFLGFFRGKEGLVRPIPKQDSTASTPVSIAEGGLVNDSDISEELSILRQKIESEQIDIKFIDQEMNARATILTNSDHVLNYWLARSKENGEATLKIIIKLDTSLVDILRQIGSKDHMSDQSNSPIISICNFLKEKRVSLGVVLEDNASMKQGELADFSGALRQLKQDRYIQVCIQADNARYDVGEVAVHAVSMYKR